MVPTRVGDHLLCDEIAVQHALPVDLARELGCTKDARGVARLGVAGQRDFVFAQIPTLGRSAAPPADAPPHPLSGHRMGVVLRSSVIAAVGRENRRVPARRISVRATARRAMRAHGVRGAAEIVDVGYACAKAQLDDWQRAGRHGQHSPGICIVNDRIQPVAGRPGGIALASRLAPQIFRPSRRFASPTATCAPSAGDP